MLQTNHCLLYLSVSFTHLKRSTDSVILIGREPCPFLFGLIWRLLQNGLYWCLLSIFYLCHFVCILMSASVCGLECIHSPCVLRPLLHVMYCNSLQSDGSKRCFIIKHVQLPFEGLTNDSCSAGPLLGLCAKHYRGSCCGGSGNSGSHWSLGKMKAED